MSNPLTPIDEIYIEYNTSPTLTAIDIPVQTEKKWSPETIASLRKLTEAGLSASMIASTLSDLTGGLFSRSSIIGKLRRLHLPLAQSQKLPEPPKRPHRSKPKPVTVPEEEIKIVEPLMIAILDMHRGMCYWPCSNAPGALFCGNTTGSRQASWCPMHRQIGYTKDRREGVPCYPIYRR